MNLRNQSEILEIFCKNSRTSVQFSSKHCSVWGSEARFIFHGEVYTMAKVIITSLIPMRSSLQNEGGPPNF